jgi:hypothetical protein
MLDGMARPGETIQEGAILRDYLASKLEKLGTDSSGWLTLYRDRSDGKLWELSYPHGELHGGGRRLLTCIGDIIPERWRQNAYPYKKEISN